MPLSAGDRLGQFEATGELGAGGMGIVLRATDTHLGRKVVLKILPDVIVPPDLQVECGGIGIIGTFEGSEDVGRVHDPDAPVLRLNGLAILGANVTTRLLGETARGARRRRRAARRGASPPATRMTE